jgi:hypothetical protein
MHPEEVVSTFRTTRWLEKTFIRSKSAGAASRTAGSKKKGTGVRGRQWLGARLGSVGEANLQALFRGRKSVLTACDYYTGQYMCFVLLL